jgi:hypothetical protein
VAVPACRRRWWLAGQLAGVPRVQIYRLLVVLRFFSSPPLLSLSVAPMCVGVRHRPPADGRPSEVGGEEPQCARALGAAPDPQAVVDGPHAAEEVRCGCGRLRGRLHRGERWSTAAGRHGPGHEAWVCGRQGSGEAG